MPIFYVNCVRHTAGPQYHMQTFFLYVFSRCSFTLEKVTFFPTLLFPSNVNTPVLHHSSAPTPQSVITNRSISCPIFGNLLTIDVTCLLRLLLKSLPYAIFRVKSLRRFRLAALIFRSSNSLPSPCKGSFTLAHSSG